MNDPVSLRRYSSLRRNNQLATNRGLLRKVPLPRAGSSVRKPMPRRNTGPAQKVRDLVFARDGHRCVHCGIRHDLVLHHRVNRGQGGSKNSDINNPTNLLVVCAGFNGLMESDAEAAQLAQSMGWKVPRSQNPAGVPVFYRGRGWKFLTRDGGLTACVNCA